MSIWGKICHFPLSKFRIKRFLKIMIFSRYTPDCSSVVKTHGLRFFPRPIRCYILKNTVQYEMVWPLIRSVPVGSETRAIPRSNACPFSIEWRLIILCHNFVFEKSFITKSWSDTLYSVIILEFYPGIAIYMPFLEPSPSVVSGKNPKHRNI